MYCCKHPFSCGGGYNPINIAEQSRPQKCVGHETVWVTMVGVLPQSSQTATQRREWIL